MINKVTQMNKNPQEPWKKELRRIMDGANMSSSKLAEVAQLTTRAIDYWLDGSHEPSEVTKIGVRAVIEAYGRDYKA